MSSRSSTLTNLFFLTARLLVGAVFIYAGAIKIIDPYGFAKNVFQYQILTGQWINMTALVLPWLEVITGLALIFVPRLRRGAAAWIGLMLMVFIAAVGFSMYRGLDISCGCLSTSPDAAKIGWKKIIENIILGALTVSIFFRTSKHD